MSRRYYLETLPDGRQQFVTVKRTKSYHHHHHPHRRHSHGSSEYYTVRRDDWNSLSERCRSLEDANRAWAADNDTLRASLTSIKAEAHRLGQTVSALEADNQSLRRSLEGSAGDHSAIHREAERLRRQVEKLEKENKDIKAENEDLRFRVGQGFSRKVTDLIREVDHWRNKYDNLWARYSSLSKIMDAKTEKMEAYEDILKRHGIL